MKKMKKNSALLVKVHRYLLNKEKSHRVCFEYIFENEHYHSCNVDINPNELKETEKRISLLVERGIIHLRNRC